MTMSHPEGSSCRWRRMISRTRRRIRLRSTAPPSVFLMLNPNLLFGWPFCRQNTVKCAFDLRFPARYTASNSPRPTSLASRGKLSLPGLVGCKAMTSLLAARREDSPAADRFHASAESVGLGPAASPRLKSALWQSNPPCERAQPKAAVVLEFTSLCEAKRRVKEAQG